MCTPTLVVLAWFLVPAGLLGLLFNKWLGHSLAAVHEAQLNWLHIPYGGTHPRAARVLTVLWSLVVLVFGIAILLGEC